MIDADALKEDLTRFYAGEVTARDLIDEQPTVGGWISVKDRLPEKDGMYLCLTMFKNKLNYQITLWGGKHWFWGYDVCYWMPLPEPPKEEEQNA